MRMRTLHFIIKSQLNQPFTLTRIQIYRKRQDKRRLLEAMFLNVILNTSHSYNPASILIFRGYLQQVCKFKIQSRHIKEELKKLILSLFKFQGFFKNKNSFHLNVLPLWAFQMLTLIRIKSLNFSKSSRRNLILYQN